MATADHRDIKAYDISSMFYTETMHNSTCVLRDLLKQLQKHASDGFYGIHRAHGLQRFVVAILQRHDFIVSTHADNSSCLISWTDDTTARKTYDILTPLRADDWAHKLFTIATAARTADNIYTRVVDVALRQNVWVTTQGRKTMEIHLPATCDFSTADAIAQRLMTNGFIILSRNIQRSSAPDYFRCFKTYEETHWFRITFNHRSVTDDDINDAITNEPLFV